MKLVLRQSDEETIVFTKGRMEWWRHGKGERQLNWKTAIVDLGGIDSRFKVRNTFVAQLKGNIDNAVLLGSNPTNDDTAVT